MDGGRSPPPAAPGAERPPVAAAASVCYIGESAPSTAAIGDEKRAAAAAPGTICHAERRQCTEVVITHISFKTMQIYLMLLKLHNNI